MLLYDELVTYKKVLIEHQRVAINDEPAEVTHSELFNGFLSTLESAFGEATLSHTTEEEMHTLMELLCALSNSRDRVFVGHPLPSEYLVCIADVLRQINVVLFNLDQDKLVNLEDSMSDKYHVRLVEVTRLIGLHVHGNVQALTAPRNRLINEVTQLNAEMGGVQVLEHLLSTRLFGGAEPDNYHYIYPTLQELCRMCCLDDSSTTLIHALYDVKLEKYNQAELNVAKAKAKDNLLKHVQAYPSLSGRLIIELFG